MNFVLDNSVSMRWLFEGGSKSDLAYADKVLASLSTMTAIVPATWSLEAANVIARGEAGGDLQRTDSDLFINLLGGLGIAVDDATHVHAFGQTLTLARIHKLSSYDASYLELALRLSAPLATLDAGLRKAARRAGVAIF